jgi:chromosome segregation ATPase
MPDPYQQSRPNSAYVSPAPQERGEASVDLERVKSKLTGSGQWSRRHVEPLVAEIESLRADLAQARLIEGELAHAHALAEQLTVAIHWNEEQRDIQAREIERLNQVNAARYELFKARNTEIERLTLADQQWADHVKRLADEVEQLKRALALVSKAGRADNEDNERLRAENQQIQGLLDHAVELMNDGTVGAGFILAENEKLKAENKRLRGIIDEIASEDDE